MRVVSHGTVYFKDPSDVKNLKRLMLSWSSCKRSAYQALNKHGLIGNAVKVYCKKHYMGPLNQRYVADAVSDASTVTQEHALFGGRKLWRQYITGKVTKSKWQQRRNNTLYSRGDKSHKGNPNIRVMGRELWVNDPSKRGGWLRGRLWVNKPVNLECYDARIQLKDGKFHVTFSWEETTPQVVTSKTHGVIGVDTNPDGLALTEINRHGNLQSHIYLKNDRIQFARIGKRDYDIKEMAVKAVEVAYSAGKPIVLEKLKFGRNNKVHTKKFRRMSHNFIYRRLIEAVKSRASKMGVEVLEVPPAYTSIVGRLKYQKMYSLSVHNAAALVIGRMGFVPRSEKVVVDVSGSEVTPKLEARGVAITLKKKSLLWFKSKFRVKERGAYLKPPSFTGTYLVPVSKTGIEYKGIRRKRVPGNRTLELVESVVNNHLGGRKATMEAW
jgi:IS605 OrfB family transposase